MVFARPHECLIGDEALARGAWGEARAAFEDVLRLREIPEALEGLGTAAWWLDLADLVFDSRERAYRLYLAGGDRAPAQPGLGSGWLGTIGPFAERAQLPMAGCSEHAVC